MEPLYYYGDDSSSSPSDNSTCSLMSSCTQCIDWATGCLWCSVPKDSPGFGRGVCLPRLQAQDSCEIGELQATCQEEAGWYVLLLTLSALLCCCCFLTMARKFAAMWHERWWIGAGGELAVPLLDEEGEEQQHAVIFRSSLVDGAGTSWRCPVCGFDNRPRCKNCDLCGITSEFAEVYWKEKDAPNSKIGGKPKRPETSVEEGKAAGGGKLPSLGAESSPSPETDTDGGEKLGSAGGSGSGSSRSEGTGGAAGGGGGGEETGRGREEDGAEEEEEEGADESESAPLLSGSAKTGRCVVVRGGWGGGGVGGGGDAPPPGGGDDSDVDSGGGGGGYGYGYGLGHRVEASPGETSEGGKARAAARFRMRRPGTLTERQKRARRRRIWQRVIGPDGKLRWLQSLDSPAASLAAAPRPAARPTAAPPAAAYQPPSVSPAPSSSSDDATAASTAAANESEAGRSRGGSGSGSGGVPAAAASAAANAAAVIRYWTASLSRGRPAAAGTAAAGGRGGDSRDSSSALASEEQARGAAAAAAAAGLEANEEEGGEEESLLSAVERGEGVARRPSPPASPPPPASPSSSSRDERGAKREREGSDRGDDRPRVASPAGTGSGGASAGGEGGGGGGGRGRSGGTDTKISPAGKTTTTMATAVPTEAVTRTRRDSFGDEVMMTKCPGYYATFLDGGGLALDEARDGEPVVQPHPLPPSATRKGQLAGEGAATATDGSGTGGGGGGGRGRGRGGGGGGGGGVGTVGFGLGTGPGARMGAGGGWAEGSARRREARREEVASEEWITSTKKEVAKLCEVASKPFWQKHSWFLDQLKLLQVPHGAGMEAMRIEVNRKNLLEDSFAQVSAMNVGELRRWLRVQFVGEAGVDAGGLEREWFMLVCSALFDPSTGLFTPQPSNGAFAINPSSGMANEMHLEYFRFTGRVLGKLLMEHSVAPYHLSLPILKHLLGLPVAFTDLEFADVELYRNLQWLRANAGAESLGLDFTVTLESFGVKEVAELVPGGKDVAVTDENKEEYLQLRLKHRVLNGTHAQLWNLMRGLYDVIPAHLISVFDYQEMELLLCGIPEIDVEEWKRCSRYLGAYRRAGENHFVIQWFWEVVEAFSEDEKARFLQFCTGSSRLPAHGFKALQSNDGSFRSFSVQSITKRESAFPRAHTCFNKLDLPMYETKKELEECLGLCICFELTGFTID
ncbi:unnamed protein product [Pylaiella littoralis]